MGDARVERGGRATLHTDGAVVMRELSGADGAVVMREMIGMGRHDESDKSSVYLILNLIFMKILEVSPLH